MLKIRTPQTHLIQVMISLFGCVDHESEFSQRPLGGGCEARHWYREEESQAEVKVLGDVVPMFTH